MKQKRLVTSTFLDRNFNGISDKFTQNIYGTTKGKIRLHIIWQDLLQILERFPCGHTLSILDAGGGQGQIALKLAKLGHQITLCDISDEMLTIAKNKAAVDNLKINCINCSIQELDNFVTEKYDVIINHAVLEWTAEPELLLFQLKKRLNNNGFLSLMFYNFHSLVFKMATLGNFGYINAGLNKRKKKTLSPNYPRKAEDVKLWLTELNYKIIDKTGIRVFHDFLINKQHQQDKFDELLMLEKTFCKQEPYLQMARYIHFLATDINNI